VLFKTRRNRFIFIELFIALIASMMMLGAMARSFSMVRNSGVSTGDVIDMRRALPVGMQIILNDLLAAGYNPTGVDGVGILLAGENAIRITADRNGDGDLLDADEDVTYAFYPFKHQINRIRKATESARPFARNVQMLSFAYYDGHNNKTTQPANIRKIKVQLKTGSHPESIVDMVTSEVIPRVFAPEMSRFRKTIPNLPAKKAVPATIKTG